MTRTAVVLVPMHVDAVVVKTPRAVVPPTADFSRLPYTRDGRDVNSEVPWLGEAIASSPLQDPSFELAPGIHLHWALPDALCHACETEAGQAGDNIVFPRVPDRWLVTRRWTTGRRPRFKRWLVESNYLHPVETPPQSRAIAYPVPTNLSGEAGKPPFRFMGRKVLVTDLPRRKDEGATYLAERLTAIGYGDPSFAAFYPNCHSVFGFHDDEFKTPSSDLSYEVLGWYDDPNQDHLRSMMQSAEGSNPAEQLARALDTLKWTLGRNRGANPEAAFVVCQGRLNFTSAKPSQRVNLPSPNVTVGNSTAEALSTYLAAQLAATRRDLGNEDDIEVQLEAMMLASRLEERQVDLGPAFDVARHGRGFQPASPSYLWSIRPAGEKVASHAPAPDWPDVSKLLDELNTLQRQYNRAWDEIRSRRRQLVADWHKYMRCAYPPAGNSEQHPNPDDIMQLVVVPQIEPLQRLRDSSGELGWQKGLSGQGAVVATNSVPTSLAQQIVNKAVEVDACLQAHAAAMQPTHTSGSAPPMADIIPRFVLQRIAAPRYFEPTEPVVLLTGEAMRSKHRYDRLAGPLGDDNKLTCSYTEIDGDIPTAVNTITTFLSKRRLWDQQTWSPPWHPFRVDWEVEVFPFARGGTGNRGAETYDDAFVKKNFILTRYEVDLATRSARPALARQGVVVRGASLLSPHGTEAYLDTVRREMAREKLTERDFGRRARGEVLRNTAMVHALQSTPMMAQSLSGFNDALLMNRPVLQLPIDDPLGFPDERITASILRSIVGSKGRRSPQPDDGFLPIRAGEMRFRRMRLVDTFGQTLDVDVSNIRSAPSLPKRSDASVMLPPRIVQPTRLHFRWHAADEPVSETHAHPNTTPICGWVVANHIDENLFVYASNGQALGYLEAEGTMVRWRSAPGREPPIVHVDPGIENAQLRQFVKFFLGGSATYFNGFLADLEAAQDLIEPDEPGEGLLMGRPLALVRACLELQLQGLPAKDQSWAQLGVDIDTSLNNLPPRDVFSKVQFPIRLGDQHRLGDGLTVYFPEDERGKYDAYVIPNYDDADDPRVDPKERKCDFLYQSIAAPPQMVTMLVDPRGKVHATMGILPGKAIDIPRHHWQDAIRRIEMSFLAAPLLVDRDSDAGEISVPLADEPGRTWMYVDKRDGAFQPPRPLRAAPLHVPFAAPVAVREGWLRLTRNAQSGQGDKPHE